MPKIKQEVMESVFFLYKDRGSAERGENAQGTGFIVACSEVQCGVHFVFYYGVTNWHVALEDGSSVIRLNTRNNATAIFEFSPDEWDFDPNGEDIAVIHLQLDPTKHQIGSINTMLFADRDSDVGVGEDAFMVGLFVDHEGRERNNPLARFGNVSMLASENSPIERRSGKNSVSHVVDMHSRTGYSGSPVFVYRTLGANLTNFMEGESVEIGVAPIIDAYNFQESPFSLENRDIRAKTKLHGDKLFKLLGINWGQFTEPLCLEKSVIKVTSGMTLVAPAWKILELINLPKFIAARQQHIDDCLNRDRGLIEETGTSNNTPNDNQHHQENFNILLDAAVTMKS